MQQYNPQNEGPIYQAGGGFYNPFVEPAWKKEKKKIRGAGNGIGLASLAYVAISFGMSFVYGLFSQILLVQHMNEVTEWVSILVIYTVSLLLPFGAYALIAKMPLGVAFPFHKARVGLTLGGACVGLGISIIASYATSYLQMALEAIGIGITMPEYNTPQTAVGMILYFVALAVAPALIEEIVFRGVIMQSLRRFGDVFALIASALIFGIFHLNMIQMPYAFILGLGIGYFVMRTGSIWVGVLIHFINNSVAVAMEFITPLISEEIYILINMAYSFICVVLAVISLAAILIKYKDIFRFESRPSALTGGKKVLYFVTSPALIIAMIVAVIFTLPYIYII